MPGVLQGGACAIASGDATGGSALDRPALEGYMIGSGWGSGVRPGVAGPVSGQESWRYATVAPDAREW